MSSYIIRLDDACATLNHDNWNKIFTLLDEYKIKAIIGVIPDNRDNDFSWEYDVQFWQKVKR